MAGRSLAHECGRGFSPHARPRHHPTSWFCLYGYTYPFRDSPYIHAAAAYQPVMAASISGSRRTPGWFPLPPSEMIGHQSFADAFTHD